MNRFAFSFLLVYLSFIGLTAPSSAGFSKCIVKRGAIDLGSSSTKLVVAEVDICKGAVIKFLPISDDTTTDESKVLKIDYTSDLEASSNQRFSEAIQTKGIEALKELMRMGSNQGVTQWTGVATGALRTSANGNKFLERVKRETGVKIILASQEEEGEIGFTAVEERLGLEWNTNTEKKKQASPKILVWDLGSKTMQLSFRNAANKLVIFDGGIASTLFKEFIITQLQHKPYSTLVSPNPISSAHAITAQAYARKKASLPHLGRVRSEIRKPNVRVVGIGGVLAGSVYTQLGKVSPIQISHLRRVLNEKISQNLSDEKINSRFADTQISNLIMVLGYMEGMGINEYHVADLNLAHGIMNHPKYQ